MKRSILKICFLIAAIVTAVAPSQAQSITANTAVSITEMTPQSGIFNRIDFLCDGCIIGSWFSTSGVLPCLVKADGLTYNAYCDLPGVSDTDKVTITIDGGDTPWTATLVKGKGWCVPLVMGTTTVTNRVVKEEKVRHGKIERTICEEQETIVGLEPGSYSLTTDVVSKDKKTRLMLGFIPINYKSKRTSSAANYVMVQRPGNVDLRCLNCFALPVWLAEHGFKTATDNLTPAVAAAQQMGQPQPQPQPQPIVPQSQAPVQPDSKPPCRLTPQPQPQQRSDLPRADGTTSVKVEVTTETKTLCDEKTEPVMTTITVIIWKGNNRQTWKNQQFDVSGFSTTRHADFIRNGAVAASVEVHAYHPELHLVEMFIYRGDFPKDGDDFKFTQEEN